MRLAIIPAPPPGQVLEFTVEAVNGDRAGVPSAPVRYPAAEAPLSLSASASAG